ncbi:hypothetical protein BDR06DRAFT_1004498 [Suillus hirtellus]|nr:hypothetical protein BDR06DRAFT_1004498 [Suillus hirtellus]
MAAAYPEYVACFEASLWVFFSGEPPAGQLRFAFPERFSTGGDEINKNCYADDYLTQQQLKKTGMTLTVLLTRSHRSLMVH